MNKQEFLAQLRKALATLPKAEVDKSISYYSEMIDDRLEDGMSEEEAVASLGSIDSIVREILSAFPAKEEKPKMKNKGLWILLICLGFPLWFPLIMGVLSTVFSVFIGAWAVIIGIFAVFLGLGLGGFGICLTSIIGFTRSIPAGLFAIGGGIICIGLSVFTLYVGIQCAKLHAKLTAFIFEKITDFLKRKECHK